MRNTARLATLPALALLAACSTAPNIIREPVVEIIDRPVYVTIPGCLTAVIPVPAGQLSALPDIAAQRRAIIETLNARMQAIAAIQGTSAASPIECTAAADTGSAKP
jgi:hypothetical protein